MRKNLLPKASDTLRSKPKKMATDCGIYEVNLRRWLQTGITKANLRRATDCCINKLNLMRWLQLPLYTESFTYHTLL